MQKLDSKIKALFWQNVLLAGLQKHGNLHIAGQDADAAIGMLEDRGISKTAPQNLPTHSECVYVWHSVQGDVETTMHVLLDFITKRLAGNGV